MELALDAGAEDIDVEDGGAISVITQPDELHRVRDALVEGGLGPDSAEVEMIPQSYSELDSETADKVMRLLENLEDLDDVQNVYTNADFPDAGPG